MDQLFSEGKSLRSGCLRAVYLEISEVLPFPVQVLFSVAKKRFKQAVTRNLIKRRIREAYRLNKSIILKERSEGKYLLIAFLYVDNTISEYSGIEKDIQKLLRKLSKTLINSNKKTG